MSFSGIIKSLLLAWKDSPNTCFMFVVKGACFPKIIIASLKASNVAPAIILALSEVEKFSLFSPKTKPKFPILAMFLSSDILSASVVLNCLVISLNAPLNISKLEKACILSSIILPLSSEIYLENIFSAPNILLWSA